MAPIPRVPPELRNTVFRGSDAVRRGLLTATMLAGNTWRRLLPDIYAEERYAQDMDPFLLRCKAAAVRMPPGAVLSGYAAVRMCGVTIGDPDDPILVLVPSGNRMNRVPGLRVREVKLPLSDVLRVRGIPITTRLRTAAEIAVAAPLADAVADVDLLLHRRYIWAEDLASHLRDHPHGRAAAVFRLADGRSESPQESRLRIRLLLAGLPAPVPQYEVCLRGRYRRLDLAWPQFKLAVEYDGIHHAGYIQLAQDRARLDDLLEGGWKVFHVTAPQLADPAAFQLLVDRIRGHLN